MEKTSFESGVKARNDGGNEGNDGWSGVYVRLINKSDIDWW